jgi:hypothetical protein
VMGTAESFSVTKPVFNDETGRRAAVLLWVGRAVITVCAILGVAIAFTLTTHIALPGLDGLVSPTLNGDQPAVALPTDPGPVSESDVTQKSRDVPDPTTRRRAKSVSSPSHRSTALAPAAHPVATGSATAKPRATTASSTPPQSKASARSSHAATPGTQGRRFGQTSRPTHPGQAKNPVP